RHRDQGDRGGSRGLVNFGEKRYIDNGWHGFPASSGPVRVGLRHSRVPAFPLISGSSGPSRELVGVTVEPARRGDQLRVLATPGLADRPAGFLEVVGVGGRGHAATNEVSLDAGRTDEQIGGEGVVHFVIVVERRSAIMLPGKLTRTLVLSTALRRGLTRSGSDDGRVIRS